jgi:hypothetical protein
MCDIYERYSLSPRTVEVHSDPTIDYNSLAYAFGEKGRAWHPLQLGSYYWPIGVTRDQSLQSHIEIFEQGGYKSIPDNQIRAETIEAEISQLRLLEKNFKTIVAIYVNLCNQVTLVSWYSLEGKWTSKLVDREDVLHKSYRCLEGSTFGNVVQWMGYPFSS